MVLRLNLTLVAISVFLLNMKFSGARRTKAAQLLEYNSQSNSYSLHADGLKEMFDQTQPIVIISAVGDSRLGKSTNLNFVKQSWNGDQLCLCVFEKAFETSDSTKPCTRGVWLSVIPRHQGSVVLMDVQGTDLGDDSVTEKLSMFTALMSSGMAMFVRGTIAHHQLNFLYRIARLSEVIFGAETAASNFPHLGVVVREALDPGEGKTHRETIVDAVVSPTHGDKMDDERKLLASYFKERDIQVSVLPYGTSETLNNFGLLDRSSPYKKSIDEMINQFKSFPPKKRMKGGQMDGKYLVELAKTLVHTMNENSWLDLPNAFILLEREVCQRSFEIAVKPLLSADLATLENKYKGAMELVVKNCSLTGEISSFQEQIAEVLSQKRDNIQTERTLRDKEEKRAIAEHKLENQKERAVHTEEIAGKDQQILRERKKFKVLETTVQQYQMKQGEVKEEVDSLKREIAHLKTLKAKNGDGVSFSLNFPWFTIRGRKEL